MASFRKFTHFGTSKSIHKLLAAPAVFATPPALAANLLDAAAKSVAHAEAASLLVTVAHHFVNEAHHCINAKTSEATPIGSVSIDLANASRLPYLSIIA